MSLPTQKSASDFTFKHTGQVDSYGQSVGNYATVQANFDSRAIYNQTQINAILATLTSETDGDSGADNISATPITELGEADTVQEQIEAIVSLGSGSIPADGTITLAKMAANSVDSDQYVDGSIDRVHLSADIIDGTKIADDAVDSEHIAAGSIDAEHLAALSVEEAKINTGAVTENKIGTGAVTAGKIGTGAVTAEKLASDAVETAKIKDAAVTKAKLHTDTLGWTAIATDVSFAYDSTDDITISSLAGYKEVMLQIKAGTGTTLGGLVKGSVILPLDSNGIAVPNYARIIMYSVALTAMSSRVVGVTAATTIKRYTTADSDAQYLCVFAR